MQIQKQIESEYEAEMNNILVDDLKRALGSLYKKTSIRSNKTRRPCQEAKKL